MRGSRARPAATCAPTTSSSAAAARPRCRRPSARCRRPASRCSSSPPPTSARSPRCAPPGLRPVPVPTDEHGVRPELLAGAFALTGARVFYCQPLYANPTGATLSADRREAVLEVVASAGAFLIEDDWARDLRIDGEAPPPLAASDPDGHVVYVRSLTKSAAPGLRVAAVSARGAAGARLQGRADHRRLLRLRAAAARDAGAGQRPCVAAPSADAARRAGRSGAMRWSPRSASTCRPGTLAGVPGRRAARLGPAAGRDRRRRADRARGGGRRARLARPALVRRRAARTAPAADLRGRASRGAGRGRAAAGGRGGVTIGRHLNVDDATPDRGRRRTLTRTLSAPP